MRSYREAVSGDTQVLQPGEPADDGGKIDQQTCEDLQKKELVNNKVLQEVVLTARWDRSTTTPTDYCQVKNAAS